MHAHTSEAGSLISYGISLDDELMMCDMLMASDLVTKYCLFFYKILVENHSRCLRDPGI